MKNKEQRKIDAYNHYCYMKENFSSDTLSSVLDSEVVEHDVNIDYVDNSDRRYKTEIVLEQITTSDAIFKYETYNFCALNFASYYNAGGGFLNGAMAQEESLCNVSNLYHILSDFRIQNKFYNRNKKEKKNALYSSRLIYTPEVLFLSGARRVYCDIITCAAPNRGAMLQKENMSETLINLVLLDRIDKVLYSAYNHGATTLILGAFGCGVFKNSASYVAFIFNELLKEKYKGVFEKVIFAVPDKRNYAKFYTEFEE